VQLESLALTNFRCFGPDPETVSFGPELTTFVGTNGSGKTAVMLALLRMFGVSGDQRRVRRQDFHVPAAEEETPAEHHLVLEAILAFPELAAEAADQDAVPAFFQQMAADEAGVLKCRLRLEATWTNDGSLEGAIDIKYRAIRTFDSEFGDEDCSDLNAIDRTRVQMIYMPATRDGATQVSSFLRSRLWRAITWSAVVREELKKAGTALNEAFAEENAVELIAEAVEKRWREIHTGATDAQPIFRPVDVRFEEFVRKIEVVFRPDEEGRDRGIEDLSDGQRSLFHIAMTAATLDVERRLAEGEEGFQAENVQLPALTLVALEEPENNLAPFYLSRIVAQLQNLASDRRAQALISSHSASILARTEPEDIRHLRIIPETRAARVRQIELPDQAEVTAKFVREAVRTYPELYFARFVILGEGASEEVVLPRLAEAMGLPIDRSFVAIVPLGGRHVNHLWKLLRGIDIPFATLLDLDFGRDGGAWQRIKTTVDQLLLGGIKPAEVFSKDELKLGLPKALKDLSGKDLHDEDAMKDWIARLRKLAVFFCDPLDLDMTMLESFVGDYRHLEDGMQGPAADADAAKAVLGKNGKPEAYAVDWADDFSWYRYLFLGRGKPTTHIRVLSRIDNKVLARDAPEVLQALLNHVAEAIRGLPDEEPE
jgi:putative ATP-dependent endonuclease of OLD family